MRWPRRLGRDRDAFGDAAPNTEPEPSPNAGPDEDPRIVGVLLAAGAATRFGSPKQLAILEQRPLVEHALDALLRTEEIDEVLVVTGAHGEAVAETIEQTGWGDSAVVLPCPEHADGLSASVRCGVAAAAARGAEGVVIHLADLPRVTTEAINAVVAHAHDPQGELFPIPSRATYAGIDGHPVVIPRACFAELEALAGDTGARDLLRGPRTRRLEVGHLGDPTDIDTPDQLEALQP